MRQVPQTRGFSTIGKKHRYYFIGRSAGWLWFNHVYPDGRLRLMIITEAEFWGPVKP